MSAARWLAIVAAVALAGCAPGSTTLRSTAFTASLNTERLSTNDTARAESILKSLEPSITKRKQDGTANLLTWQDLYEPLDADQRKLIDAMRRVKAEALGATSHFFGETNGAPSLVPVGLQLIAKNGVSTPLDPQFLPSETAEAYRRMMDAMRKDLGRELLVESAYRSPAYQLYLFLYYMPKHGWSIRETNRFVALPGYSEHGNPRRQAIDFINEAGINGEDRPEEFEVLPEYRWLQEHAREFGFYLSYPRNNPHNTAFEPWHWHHEPSETRLGLP